ncbi:MAG: sensor domain-containing diguanylate cyclase [Candidatus Nitrosotenuis sp.]
MISASLRFQNCILDSLDEQIAIISRAGQIVYVNRAWVDFGRINGAPLDYEWQNKNYFDACKEAIKSIYDGLKKYIAGKIDWFEHEYPCEVNGAVHWFTMKITRLNDEFNDYFCVMHFDITQRKANELKVEQLSRIDHLTGLANRRAFDDVMNCEWKRAVRFKHNLTVIMIDVDYFKLYNDTFGHQQGDKILAQISETLKGFAKRPGDLAARYGGEEFALILTAVSRASAVCIASQVRKAIELLDLPHVNGRVTVSIGVATIKPKHKDHFSTLIKMADEALYEAKYAGRNCVKCSSECVKNL